MTVIYTIKRLDINNEHYQSYTEIMICFSAFDTLRYVYNILYYVYDKTD